MRSRNVEFSLTGATLVLLGLLLVTFVAFLGLTLFNTKGEPREAIVAVSMLNQGNWILPVSCGADIPYKPPMLAWMIAALGWLNGGHVTVFLARLPSALAAIVMIVCLFRFYARRGSMAVAMVGALLTATAFEVHRAATSCRVDMVLTAFIVMAILSLYRHYESGKAWWRLPLTAILLMSGGVLTKGPVGMLLPCGSLLVWMLLTGRRFWPSALQLTLYGVLALILPAMWYVAAYGMGGQEFYDLAMEENFGRFFGKMSYGSHEHTFLYNFLTLLWGWAPWTLLALGALFSWRRLFPSRADGAAHRFADRARGFWNRLRALPPAELLAVAAAVVIFVFYCIPKSKRSVYLLPMYPFMAIGFAMLIRRLSAVSLRTVRVFGFFMAGVGILACLAACAAMMGLIPEGTGKAAVYIAEARGLGIGSLLVTVAVLVWLAGSMRSLARGDAAATVQWTVLDTLMVYWVFMAAIQPVALNPKSDRAVGEYISENVPDDTPVYGFMTIKDLRYFTAGFYSGDRITGIDPDSRPAMLAQAGYVLAGEADTDSLRKFMPEGTLLSIEQRWDKKSCDNKQKTQLFRYFIPVQKP